MATDKMPLPSAGTADSTSSSENNPNTIQLAQANGQSDNGQGAGDQGTGQQTNGAAPGNPVNEPPIIPAVPNGEVQVTIPPDATVVRVAVAPGETVDLPFTGDLAARFGQQGNLAIKVGDQTIILIGYAEANQQAGVTLHDSQGHAIDVASVVAQTDPNLDIQTAAGATGAPGGQGGHLFIDFQSGAGLGGFGELGIINQTALTYSLISPDETILPPVDTDGQHQLRINSTNGGATTEITNLTLLNNPIGDPNVGNYLLNTSKDGVAINPALVNGVDPANLHITFGADVTVTFERADASYHSMVGVYAFDASGNIIPGSVQFLWLDATQTSENVLGAPLVTDFLGNTQHQTVDLGQVPAGENLGFFLVQNGAMNAADIAIIEAAAGPGHDMALLNSKTTISYDSSGIGHVFVDGHELSSTVIFTDKSHNPGDDQQAISGVNTPADGSLYVGFEDKNLSVADKDYNDVVFGVNPGAENIANFDHQVFSPHIQLGDTANDITQVSIVTTGFLLGDALNNLADANGFHVDVTKLGDNYDVTITETKGHSTGDWQNFVNGIDFTSTSTSDGTRDISYTVQDTAGHSGTTTAHVDVTTQHTESLSLDSTIVGHSAVTETWQAGDDTLYLDQHFTGSDGKLDMGAGNNTLHIGANGLNITAADTAHLANVDHIDMTGYNTGGGNSTTLDGKDVLSMTDSSHELQIDGDVGDKVNLGGNAVDGHWHQIADVQIGGNTYAQWQWHDVTNVTATVLINDHLTQTVTDTI